MKTTYTLPSQTAPTPLAAGFIVHVLAAALGLGLVARVALAAAGV